MAGYGIVANAHDLGIEAGEPCQFGMERRDLGGSGGRPVEGMKGKHNVLLAVIIGKAEFDRALANYACELEIGRHSALRQCGHAASQQI